LNCVKTALRANLSKELNCNIPGFDNYFNDFLDLKECSNELQGVETNKKYQKIMTDFNFNPELYGCKLPCARNSYTFVLNTFHFNSIKWDGSPELQDENYYHLFFYYKSTLVPKQVEVLVYDFGGFIAAAGGNLGLCLGFSCLSILFTVTHWTKTVFVWAKKYSLQ